MRPRERFYENALGIPILRLEYELKMMNAISLLQNGGPSPFLIIAEKEPVQGNDSRTGLPRKEGFVITAQASRTSPSRFGRQLTNCGEVFKRFGVSVPNNKAAEAPYLDVPMSRLHGSPIDP